MKTFNDVTLILFACLCLVAFNACNNEGDKAQDLVVECNEEELGSFSYSVNRTQPGQILNALGGRTTDARITKIEDIDMDIILLETEASVTDGVTCVSGFKFTYNMTNQLVVDIEELIFGCDTTIIYDKDLLDVSLDIDSLDENLTNVSGELSGVVMQPDSINIGINFFFIEIPICFE